jgi:hypothetical protein
MTVPDLWEFCERPGFGVGRPETVALLYSVSKFRTRIREGSTTTIDDASLCSGIVANILSNDSQIALSFQSAPRKSIKPLRLSGVIAINRGKSRSAVMTIALSFPAAPRISLSEYRPHPLSKTWDAS